MLSVDSTPGTLGRLIIISILQVKQRERKQLTHSRTPVSGGNEIRIPGIQLQHLPSHSFATSWECLSSSFSTRDFFKLEFLENVLS